MLSTLALPCPSSYTVLRSWCLGATSTAAAAVRSARAPAHHSAPLLRGGGGPVRRSHYGRRHTTLNCCFVRRRFARSPLPPPSRPSPPSRTSPPSRPSPPFRPPPPPTTLPPPRRTRTHHPKTSAAVVRAQRYVARAVRAGCPLLPRSALFLAFALSSFVRFAFVNCRRRPTDDENPRG